jgi:hypothetical protein
MPPCAKITPIHPQGYVKATGLLTDDAYSLLPNLPQLMLPTQVALQLLVRRLVVDT